jgi:dihydroorotate dehydrogenase (NAD+) catalytic subunit
MPVKLDMGVALGPLKLKNPVMTASGTFGYGQEYAAFMDLNRLGAVVVKGLSLEPSHGNPPPRIVETASGMLNAIGLENVGLKAFAHSKLPFLRSLKTPVIVNIYGRSVDEYARLAERLDQLAGIAALEINISCPNVKAGGVAFGTHPKMAARVVRAVRRKTALPLIAKLSPNVTDVVVMARSAADSGADILSLINTITGMAIDAATRRPKLANVTGGLSGPAIKPVALRMVWQVAKSVAVPVIGIGGIASGTDALEFLIAGASAVQVGTANFVNPAAAVNVIAEMEDFLIRHGIARAKDLIGTLVV